MYPEVGRGAWSRSGIQVSPNKVRGPNATPPHPAGPPLSQRHSWENWKFLAGKDGELKSASFHLNSNLGQSSVLGRGVRTGRG